ncbi:insulinase family protein [soil metagenome]
MLCSISRLSLVVITTIFLLPLEVGAVGAQQRGAEALAVDQSVVAGQLENGLRYFIRKNSEPEARAELRLVVNAGSVLEDRDQLGLAHFLEHMAFNGTVNFERQELVDYLELVGMRFGPDVNAYTSFDETVYMLTLPTDTSGVLETGMQILEDWAWGISLDSLEIEKERGVVIEEWRLGRGAGTRMQNRQFPVLMQRSRYAERLPIGTLESLATFKHSALGRFYNDWYRPDLMAVVAVGDFDPEQVRSLIHEHFSRIPAKERPRARREFIVPSHRETRISVATDPEAQGSTVSLYMKREPVRWSTAQQYRSWIVESLASSMLTNRLAEATHSPDAPILDVSSFQGRFIRPLAAYVLTARVQDHGIERGLEALLTETDRAAQHGFVASELEREKVEIMRGMEQRYAERNRTTSGAFASDYVSHFLYGGSILSIEAEHELYRRFLPEITIDEVNRRARAWMQDRDRVVLVRAPAGAAVEVPSERRLRRIVAATRNRKLEPYDDNLSTAPLVRRAPEPGTIQEERTIPEIGVHEWVLSNGARVLLKPTDFREDEILMAARSPGGTSLFGDDDYIPALTASAVVQVGGAGELSASDLRKRLAGVVAGVGAEIGEQHEGLSGAASRQDLETLFQLIHLKFTAPRMDSVAFLTYQAQARAAIQSRVSTPESALQDTLRVVLSQNHPRARPPTSAMFDHLDLHRSFEIYGERFGDASDFTFYFVGNFDVDQLRGLTERYIASLPGSGRVESGRDLGVRPPRGVVHRTVYRGLEPKALTQIVFTGEFDFSQDNLYRLHALGEVLQLRLREVLREEMSGTYGTGVRASGGAGPWPQYQLAIGFGTSPERLDELTGAVFREIETLRATGPSAVDLQKVREMMIRGREVDSRMNHFWLQQMLVHHRHGWDLRAITADERRLAAVDALAIQQAAVRYLDPSNYVQVSLVPEADAHREDGP